jgi:hypothetical protein
VTAERVMYVCGCVGVRGIALFGSMRRRQTKVLLQRHIKLKMQYSVEACEY